jgi:hypothetical protein
MGESPSGFIESSLRGAVHSRSSPFSADEQQRRSTVDGAEPDYARPAVGSCGSCAQINFRVPGSPTTEKNRMLRPKAHRLPFRTRAAIPIKTSDASITPNRMPSTSPACGPSHPEAVQIPTPMHPSPQSRGCTICPFSHRGTHSVSTETKPTTNTIEPTASRPIDPSILRSPQRARMHMAGAHRHWPKGSCRTGRCGNGVHRMPVTSSSCKPSSQNTVGNLKSRNARAGAAGTTFTPFVAQPQRNGSSARGNCSREIFSKPLRNMMAIQAKAAYRSIVRRSRLPPHPGPRLCCRRAPQRAEARAASGPSPVAGTGTEPQGGWETAPPRRGAPSAPGDPPEVTVGHHPRSARSDSSSQGVTPALESPGPPHCYCRPPRPAALSDDCAIPQFSQP